MADEWFDIRIYKPEHLRFIKFVTRKGFLVTRGHYVIDEHIRSVHVGQYSDPPLSPLPMSGKVFSIYSGDMNDKIATDNEIDLWAYIDLSGPPTRTS